MISDYDGVLKTSKRLDKDDGGKNKRAERLKRAFSINIEHDEIKPKTIWFTGRCHSKLNTFAKLLTRRLKADGKQVCHLDEETSRRGINSDLATSKEDRVESIRRVAEIAKLQNALGIYTVIAIDSQREEHRDLARDIVGNAYFQVYVQSDLSSLNKYSKSYVGIEEDDEKPFEIPASSDYILDSLEMPSRLLVDEIVALISDSSSSNSYLYHINW